MILQIATRSGLPPSVIAATWKPDELQNAEALADLEGWGQDKRRTAAMQAEIANVGQLLFYAQTATDKTPPPKMLTESHFLPRRVRRKATSGKPVADKVVTTNRKVASILNSMCGY